MGVPGTSGGNRDMHRARDSQIYKQIVRGRSASGADNSGPLGSLGEDMGDGDESVRENCKNEHERGHGHGHKREQEQERGLKINQQKCGQGQQQGDDADAEEDEDATLTVSSASTANRDPRSRPDPVRVYSSVSAGTPSPLLDQINIHVETEEHEEI